ncbi:MAG: hypothetical protein ABIL38_03270, partial [candidate division WOR-3 bacterium]
ITSNYIYYENQNKIVIPMDYKVGIEEIEIKYLELYLLGNVKLYSANLMTVWLYKYNQIGRGEIYRIN